MSKLPNDSPMIIGQNYRKSTGTLQEIKGNFVGISETPLRKEVAAFLVVPMAHFGLTIRRLRLARHLSAAELGVMVGVTEKQVFNWEKRVDSTLQGRNYRKLAQALNLTTDQLDKEWRDLKVDQSVGDPVRRGIPLINKAPAGAVVDYHECSIVDSGQGQSYIGRDSIEDPNAFAVVIFGKSMEPTLLDGVIAVFSPMSTDGHLLFNHRKISEGHVVFIRFGSESKRDGCTIARLFHKGRKLRLVKDNTDKKKYPDIECVPSDIAKLAAMIRHDDLPGMTKTFSPMEQFREKTDNGPQPREGQIHPDHENPNEKHPE